MFHGATSFDKDIGNFKIGMFVGKGRRDFTDMFYNATSSNRNLCGWEVSNTANVGGFCTLRIDCCDWYKSFF